MLIFRTLYVLTLQPKWAYLHYFHFDTVTLWLKKNPVLSATRFVQCKHPTWDSVLEGKAGAVEDAAFWLHQLWTSRVSHSRESEDVSAPLSFRPLVTLLVVQWWQHQEKKHAKKGTGLVEDAMQPKTVIVQASSSRPEWLLDRCIYMYRTCSNPSDTPSVKQHWLLNAMIFCMQKNTSMQRPHWVTYKPFMTHSGKMYIYVTPLSKALQPLIHPFTQAAMQDEN